MRRSNFSSQSPTSFSRKSCQSGWSSITSLIGERTLRSLLPDIQRRKFEARRDHDSDLDSVRPDWKPRRQWSNLHARGPEFPGRRTPAKGGSGAMRMKFCAALMLGIVLSASLCAHSINARDSYRSGNPFIASDCDRACLYGFVDQYLAALLAKDPARVPWAKTVKFTENNVVLQIGDGLWGTISGMGADDLRAADPTDGQVAYYGVVDERGNKAFFALRLKVEDRKISEVETIVDRKG